MVQTDPITVATIWHFLQRLCVEMRQTMERTATNVLATSLHDLAYGIWDAEARVIAIPEGFPCRYWHCYPPCIFIAPRERNRNGSGGKPGRIKITDQGIERT